jgi:hypothetical protein
MYSSERPRREPFHVLFFFVVVLDPERQRVVGLRAGIP